jgi:predicted metal-binding protein
MSCRIDRLVGGDNLIVLCITGKLTEEHVGTLRNALRREAGALAIDLKNVSLVDREAVKLLTRCETNGTELRNCPPYIREWVTRERAERKTRRSDQRL